MLGLDLAGNMAEADLFLVISSGDVNAFFSTGVLFFRASNIFCWIVRSSVEIESPPGLGRLTGIGGGGLVGFLGAGGISCRFCISVLTGDCFNSDGLLAPGGKGGRDFDFVVFSDRLVLESALLRLCNTDWGGIALFDCSCCAK